MLRLKECAYIDLTITQRLEPIKVTQLDNKPFRHHCIQLYCKDTHACGAKRKMTVIMMNANINVNFMV